MPVFKTVSQWTVFQWSFEKTSLKTNDKKSEIHSGLKFPHSWFPSFSIWLFSLLILFFLFLHIFFLFSLLNLVFPHPPQFYYNPFSSSAFSFILYIFPSTNTSTSYRPCIDPRLFFRFSTQLRGYVYSETIYNHHHISIVSIIHKAYLLWLFQ